MNHLTHCICLSIALTACAPLATSTALADAKQQYQPKITMADAREKALALVPGGTVVAEELEHEGGRWIYSFEIRPKDEKGKLIKEVNIDSDTGAVGGVETEND